MGREKLGISELILSDFTFTYDITVHLCIVLTFSMAKLGFKQEARFYEQSTYSTGNERKGFSFRL